MQSIQALKRKIDFSRYQKRSASDEDYDLLIDEDAVVTVDGVPKIVYLANVKNPAVLSARQAVQTIKYSTSTRTSGLVTRSRIFGYSPRNVLRGHACRATSMAVDCPSEHSIVCGAAAFANSEYEKWFPDVHRSHAEMLGKVRPEWVIPKSVFTSGIVNYNNPLQYHFDSGNFASVCSAMIGFRHKTQGGVLSCPEIGMGFAIGDCSLILFDGQKLLHGVTPIRKTAKDAFRYTIVYYSLKQMWNCDSVKGEIDALRERRTATERKRIHRP